MNSAPSFQGHEQLTQEDASFWAAGAKWSTVEAFLLLCRATDPRHSGILDNLFYSDFEIPTFGEAATAVRQSERSAVYDLGRLVLHYTGDDRFEGTRWFTLSMPPNEWVSCLERAHIAISPRVANEVKATSSPLKNDMPQLPVARSAPAIVTEQLLPETRNGHSDKLVTLNQAAKRFWANALPNDPSTHPENAKIVQWLVARGYTESLASKGATIIRPSWAFVGRKPDIL